VFREEERKSEVRQCIKNLVLTVASTCKPFLVYLYIRIFGVLAADLLFRDSRSFFYVLLLPLSLLES